MPAADKEDVRSELLQSRRALTDTQIASARVAVRQHVLTLVKTEAWRSVAAYVPLRTEPGSVELLDELQHAGVRVLVPITLDDHDLDWDEWGSNSAPLGLSALAQVDAIFVPALAVAADGTRLGRGGGSYDRALTRARQGTPVIALLYADEVRAELPVEPWDQPVTGYVTPAGWHPIGLWNS